LTNKDEYNKVHVTREQLS